MKNKLLNWYQRQPLREAWLAYIAMAALFIVSLVGGLAVFSSVGRGLPAPVLVSGVLGWVVAIYWTGDVLLEMGMILDMARRGYKAAQDGRDDELAGEHGQR